MKKNHTSQAKPKKKPDSALDKQAHVKPPESDSPGLGYLMRGILVGSALGVFAVLLGLFEGMPRGLALGGMGGFLAGMTIPRLRRARQRRIKANANTKSDSTS